MHNLFKQKGSSHCRKSPFAIWSVRLRSGRSLRQLGFCASECQGTQTKASRIREAKPSLPALGRLLFFNLGISTKLPAHVDRLLQKPVKTGCMYQSNLEGRRVNAITHRRQRRCDSSLKRRFGQRISTATRANITSNVPSTRYIPTAKAGVTSITSKLRLETLFLVYLKPSRLRVGTTGTIPAEPAAALLCRKWGSRLKGRLKTYVFVLVLRTEMLTYMELPVPELRECSVSLAGSDLKS
jgi:hypothetical protein